MKHKFLLLGLALFICSALFAAVNPSVTLTDYYANANSKSGNELRLALRAAIDHHTNITYGKLGYIMKYADTKNADGIHLIDIYSDVPYSTMTKNKDGKNDIDDEKVVWISGGQVGDGLNREHTIPQSWFGKSDPMVADAFHIYPTDAKCNNHRSDNLYGEVYPASSAVTYTNGSYSELGALGDTYKDATDLANSTYTYESKSYTLVAYDGKVYEPADEFKGDIARGIFYMATRYASPEANDGTDCSTWQNKTNPTHFAKDENGGVMGLSPYTIALMLKWHRQDPVSEKELLRNEVIYGNQTYNKSNYKQGNRNPFIDYPELVEYLWGNKAGQTVTVANLTSAYTSGGGGGGGGQQTDPVIDAPKTISIETEPYEEGSKIVTISWANLTTGPTFKIDTKFLLDTFSTTWGWDHIYGDEMTLERTTGSIDLRIRYENNAYENASHTANLTITAGSKSATVQLKGESYYKQTVLWYADGILVQQDAVKNGEKVQAIPAAPNVPTQCSGKEFVGWSSEEFDTEWPFAPTDLFTTLDKSPKFYDKYWSKEFKMYAIYATPTVSGSSKKAEFGFSDYDGQGKPTSGDVMTATKNGATVVFSKGNATEGSPIRSYSAGKITVSSSDNISKIEFKSTVYKSNGADKLSASTGKYEYSSDKIYGTWTGTAKSIEFTCGAQIRFDSVKVTIGGTVTYSNFISRCAPYYTITFKYGEGTDEKQDFEVREGVIPSYPYYVSKDRTNAYEFEFDCWNPTPVPATQNTTYNAVFDTIVRLYNIRYDLIGAFVEPAQVAWNEPIPQPADPVFYCHARQLVGWYTDMSYNTPFDFANTRYTFENQEEMTISGKSKLAGDAIYIVEHSHTIGADLIREYDTVAYTIPATQEMEWVAITLTPHYYFGFKHNPNDLGQTLQLCEDTARFLLTYQEDKDATYTVVATTNNTAYGSAQASGNTAFAVKDLTNSTFALTLTATPASTGYSFAAWVTPAIQGTMTDAQVIAAIKANPTYAALLCTNPLTLNGSHIQLLNELGLIQTNAKNEIPVKAIFVENTATGMDACESVSQPQKLLINGQLFILRDGILYTVTGAKVE